MPEDANKPSQDSDLNGQTTSELTELLNLDLLESLRLMVAGRELVEADCEMHGGRNVLWPATIGNGVAVATGPEGTSLTLDIVQDEGGVEFLSRDLKSGVVPLCGWLGTLVPNDWDAVVSRSLRLPVRWLARTDQHHELTSHALGTDFRDRLESDVAVMAEMGFVGSTSEENGVRRFQLQIIAKERFLGHAIVELQFLDRNGQVLAPEMVSERSKHIVRPRLVEFTSMRRAPRSDEERRVVVGLGEQLVEAQCHWRIPRNPRRVSRCRVAVRPLTPDEALRFSRGAEPLPFVGNETTGYSAMRRRSGIGLGNQLEPLKHGFLLTVVDREKLLNRLVPLLKLLPEQTAGKLRDADMLQSDVIQIARDAIDRGTDTLLLQTVVGQEDILRYLLGIFWKRHSELRRQKSGIQTQTESELGKDYALADMVASASSPQTDLVFLMERLAELGIETFDQQVEVALKHVANFVREEHWHWDMVQAILRDGLTLGEVADRFGQERGTVEQAFHRLLNRLKSSLRTRFPD